jgi:hypothetical protein
VLLDLVSPTSAFVRDLCVRGPEHEIEIKELYQAWRDWCVDNGHHPTASTVFSRDLRAVHSKLRVFKPHAQPRRFGGLTLKSKVKVEPTYKGNGGSSGSSGGSSTDGGSTGLAEPPSESLEPSEPPFPFYVARTADASEAGGDRPGENPQNPETPTTDSGDVADVADKSESTQTPDDTGLCPSCDKPFDSPNPNCSAADWHGDGETP